MQRICTCFVVLLLAPLAASPAAEGPRAAKPNIIYILADDLGIGDVGCYGQRLLKTPRIDQLAAEGMRFTEHYRKPLSDCSMEELWQGQLDIELTQLDSLREQQTEVERRLEAIAEEDERIQRVQTIPGVGRKTAEVLVTALDDVHRFDNARQVSAYIGLVDQYVRSYPTSPEPHLRDAAQLGRRCA